ncbi:hypothetical protein QYF61_025201 [Mycteria americana]|uniref:Receptor ligand binding region domain-containing protein n=1 Tax=Mycteria americana TaxID=33587 RepID=A0AAN7N6S9_MYCAM|nr:hypothetical protein QYF61_025201 [Mycteria americana]
MLHWVEVRAAALLMGRCRWRGAGRSHTSDHRKLSSALLFDAVYAVVTAVQELNRSQEIGVKPLSCGSAQIWQHGTSLMNYLRMVELEGLTGHIEFNSKGQRSNYALKILQHTRNGFRQSAVVINHFQRQYQGAGRTGQSLGVRSCLLRACGDCEPSLVRNPPGRSWS